MAQDLRAVLRERLTSAMKQRDAVSMRVLRSTIAAIENAEAPSVDSEQLRGLAIERSPHGVGAGEVDRVRLTARDVRAVVRREIDDRLAAAASYERTGRDDHAAQLRAEAAVLSDLGASAV